MKILSPLIFALSLLAACQGQLYPSGWIRSGECLDMNEGPLLISVKPLINQNIIGNATSGVTSIDDCMALCLAQPICRYFTWYPMLPSPMGESDCHLVGFNLRQACFNLANVCVLMKECETFNTTCATCQTGMRPFIDPRTEPLTVIMNGMTDNRFYLQQETRQFTISAPQSNLNELIINLDVNKTCLFRNTNLTARMGSVSGYFNSSLYVCGGFEYDDSTSSDSSMALGNYVNNCQKFVDKNSAWSNAPRLNISRAFASSVVGVDKYGNDEFYILGGYSRTDGFIVSVEKLKNGKWVQQPNMSLPFPKSHFCTIFLKNQYGVRSLFTIGGWNIQYTPKFHRLTFNDTSDTIEFNEGDGNWQTLKSLRQARADHACAVMQYGWTWGILVAGGYGDEAWLSSVEFFDFEKDRWSFVASLNDPRHYHGLTSIGLLPMVFGGWNNGSLNSYEILSFDQSTPAWQKVDNFLQISREKFAYARVPRNFTFNCN